MRRMRLMGLNKHTDIWFEGCIPFPININFELEASLLQ